MIKKGLKVKILAGKDKNKDGEVIEIDRKSNRAKVKGINMVKKHIKTTKEKKGGIVSKENFLDISNLSIIENKTKSTEHGYQCKDYLDDNSGKNPHLIYLTLAGDNPETINIYPDYTSKITCLSYIELARYLQKFYNTHTY